MDEVLGLVYFWQAFLCKLRYYVGFSERVIVCAVLRAVERVMTCGVLHAIVLALLCKQLELIDSNHALMI